MSQMANRAIAQSKAKKQQHHVGQKITVQIFGRMVTGKIMAIHPFGTVDIDSPIGCFRCSGLSLTTK